MGETSKILNTLKLNLKAQGKTYIDVANALKLSEASVKRLFAEESFSLSRLDVVCNMLNIKITDLVLQANEESQRIDQLTEEQERKITEDTILLLVLVCAFNHWTIKDMTEYYTINESQCITKLLQLDRLGLIELLPSDKIKLLISPNFKWIDGGPIQRFFKNTIGSEFFNTDFKDNDQCLHVLNGMLTSESAAILQKKFYNLVQEFESLNQLDSSIDFDKRNGTTFVLAMRNWEYGFFNHLRRQR